MSRQGNKKKNSFFGSSESNWRRSPSVASTSDRSSVISNGSTSSHFSTTSTLSSPPFFHTLSEFTKLETVLFQSMKDIGRSFRVKGVITEIHPERLAYYFSDDTHTIRLEIPCRDKIKEFEVKVGEMLELVIHKKREGDETFIAKGEPIRIGMNDFPVLNEGEGVMVFIKSLQKVILCKNVSGEYGSIQYCLKLLKWRNGTKNSENVRKGVLLNMMKGLSFKLLQRLEEDEKAQDGFGDLFVDAKDGSEQFRKHIEYSIVRGRIRGEAKSTVGDYLTHFFRKIKFMPQLVDSHVTTLIPGHVYLTRFKSENESGERMQQEVGLPLVTRTKVIVLDELTAVEVNEIENFKTKYMFGMVFVDIDSLSEYTGEENAENIENHLAKFICK